MKKNNNIRLGTMGKRILVCILPLVFYFVLHITNLNNEQHTRIVMRIALFAIAGYGACLWCLGKLKAEQAVTLIILAGIIVRSGYTAYTNAFVRSHDMGSSKPDGVGHWGYLYNIINGNLPPSNQYQFYQQPFYYILSSLFIRITQILISAENWEGLIYMAQQVSCIGSCIALVFFAEIMKKLNIRYIAQIPAILLCAFYPAQILAAGRMNNDALVLMFMVLSLYFTLMWHKDRTFGYIIGIALSIGFGMMTKINCGLIALVTGPIMLYHLIKAIKDKNVAEIKSLVIQLSVFAVICFPLGLWYPIRNYIAFGQPLNYVHDIGKGSFVYTGDASWIDRWVKIPFSEFINTPYMNMKLDSSIPMSMIKTGVHGEFSYENLPMPLAWGLDYLHALILLMVFANVAFVAINRKEIDNTQKYAVLWVWIMTIVSYIQFNFAFPYMCTADFRYLLLWQMSSAAIVSIFYAYCYKKHEKRIFNYLFKAESVLVGVFALCCILHFC